MFREKTRPTARLFSRDLRAVLEETLMEQKRLTPKSSEHTTPQRVEPIDALQESLRKYPPQGTPFLAFTAEQEAWFKKNGYPFKRVKTSN
jgi:hypothetical protein